MLTSIAILGTLIPNGCQEYRQPHQLALSILQSDGWGICHVRRYQDLQDVCSKGTLTGQFAWTVREERNCRAGMWGPGVKVA